MRRKRIILPLLICGGLNLLYNGDKIKKITNPKKAFIRTKGIVIASLVMILLFVFLNNAPINSLNFNLSKVFANISLTLFGGGYVFIPYLDKIIVVISIVTCCANTARGVTSTGHGCWLRSKAAD